MAALVTRFNTRDMQPYQDTITVVDGFSDRLNIEVTGAGMFVYGSENDVMVHDDDMVTLLRSIADLAPALLAKAGLTRVANQASVTR